MATNRIKTLQTSLPRGAPIDTATLARLGVSVSLAHEYVKGGWLEKLGRGVFTFVGDELKRNQTLGFMESRIPGLHVAAKTALAWHGYRHNIAIKETVILWGNRLIEHNSVLSGREKGRNSSTDGTNGHE